MCCYTLAHPDPSFLHQHVVDAFTAQQASERTKPISLTFALVGLFLHIEKHFSGKEVQRAHMKLARKRRPWPALSLPVDRREFTVANVMAASPGPERDQAIHEWCVSVWAEFGEHHEAIAGLLQQEHIA